MAMASLSSRSQTTSSSSPRFYSSPFASYTSANFAAGASSFATRSSSSSYGHHHRSSPQSPTSSVRFSRDQRAGSPGRRSITVTKNQRNNGAVSSSSSSSSHHQKRTCMCSPTTHPGSFRCAYHKRLAEQQKEEQTASCHSSSSSSSGNNNKLNLRRSAMKNSLVRIGGVEGELVKRALTSLIRPSSHHQRRREAFQPRPSRLSVMSKAQDSF